jgi:signal transduction histidine kinase
MAMRNWRISTRLVSLLALPVVAATSLGALRIQSSLENVDQLNNMGSLTDITERTTELAASLQEERDSSAGPLAGKPRDAKNDSVVATREATDRAKRAFDSATADLPQGLKGVSASLVAISRELSNLAAIRDNAYTDDQYISQTVNDYDQLIQSLLSLSQDMAQATNNPEMINATRALAAFSAAKEYDSIQRAVIGAALANDKNLQPNDWRYVESSNRSEQTSLQRFQSIYGSAASEVLLKALTGGNDTITQVNREQQRIAASEGGIQSFNGSYRDWDDEAKSKILAMKQIEQSLLSEMQVKAQSLSAAAQREAIINGAIIVLVLGISVIGAFVVARSMIRSLRRLQDTAQDVAQRRLPELVKHLSESDPQDVDTSVESIGIHSRDEIGRVARAFDEVHREAVRLASEQALLRGNVNAMFTNLSRRSQGLIQRQLSLISELESREADPDQLSSLFKLDHLATRMRRNGENLLVLAGEEPGRRWTRPVPLVDVLRAAASEVEQYERIELTSVPASEVTGRVVNDLVHLLAELLENATSFSSPQTKVRVTGHALPDGRVLIEIHDTGIGLSPEDLADINERLANPPTVDVSVSRRMGLFVVGRLSLRHGIRIQLRPSDSGGTTALVMLPVDVTQGGKQVPGKRGAGGPGGAPSSGGPGAGQVGRGAQRGQVPGGEPRPALNAGGPGGSGGPQGGRSSAPRSTSGPGSLFSGGSGTGATAPQRTSPSWAQEQAQGRPGGSGGPTGPGQGRPQQPQPASADFGSTGDAARGHEDGDAASRLGAVPHTRPQGDPADTTATAQFPRPQFNAPPPAAPGALPHTGPQSAARFERPPGTSSAPGARPDPGQGGGGRPGPGFQRSDVFQRPAHRPEPPQRQGAPDSGQRSGPGRPEPYPAGATNEFQQPGNRPAPQRPGGQPEPYAPDRTAEFQRPGAYPYPQPSPGAPPAPQPPRPVAPQQRPANAGGRPAEQQARGTELPPAAEPMALPPAPVRPDERSPIFEALESDWFRAGRAERMQQIHVESGTNGGGNGTNGSAGVAPADAPGAFRPGNGSAGRPAQRRAAPAGARTAQPQAAGPRSGPQRPGAPAAGQRREGPNWRSNPNDEVWQRAEQVREPSSGGVTPSGLPRRVPRANLVPGGATQQTPQGGPQVSRAPDDVRGRLTNLRRGIQQGRQAGTGLTDGRAPENHWGGTTHQQER